MKIKHVFYSILLLLVCITGKSQFPGFSKTADRYFSMEEYRELIKQAAINAAVDQGIPESVFIEKYADCQSAVEALSRPTLLKRFRWLEAGTSSIPVKGTPAFNKRKEAYTRELQRGVRDAMNANRLIFKSILNIDQADRILSFHSDVMVNKKAVLTVVETIRVYNGNGETGGNNEIQRGIKRSFPTRYTNSMGMLSTVPFRIKKVLMNKEPEPYFTAKAGNGILLYIGRKDKILNAGIYTYEITYETERQVIFHKEKDECYWNVNGTGWSFTCEKVSCTIHFPDSTTVIESNCYTGLQGNTQHACSSDSSKTNTIYFKSGRILQPYEGLTVAASIPKGFIEPPPLISTVLSFLKDNLILAVLLLTALLLFFFHFRAWRRVGRDPKTGVIIPQFEPPAGMSAADTGYLLKQDYGPHLFAASIVDHAIHHKLNIEVKKEGILFKTPVYYFQRPDKLSADSGTTDPYYKWYGYSISSLYGQKAEKGKYNSQIAAVYKKLEEQLKERLLIRKGKKNTFKGLFSLNDNYAGAGIVALIVIGIASVIYLGIFHTTALVITSIILFVVCIIIQAVFMKIMSAYTREGRAVADHVAGFRMYLKAAEENRFDLMNPPEMTIQLFEKYLPYAIALQCENAWATRFEDIIQKAAETGYQPTYYHGVTGSNFSSSFTTGLSSGLAGTIASASTPPSSSSGGSSGGGSSGGGGGGGGGGGW